MGAKDGGKRKKGAKCERKPKKIAVVSDVGAGGAGDVVADVIDVAIDVAGAVVEKTSDAAEVAGEVVGGAIEVLGDICS